MRKLRLIFILTTIFILLSSCEDGRHLIIYDLPIDDAFDVQDEPYQTRHLVFIESQPMRLAMHEPSEGAFIGMYTDAIPGFDGRVIAAIESSLGVNHAAFMEVMHLGSEFPYLWVLECIAEQKIPILVILPPENGVPFGSHWQEILTETATSFGQFPIPMFVVFYPVSAETNSWDPATYIAFFRYARAIFAAHAPSVAFIWSIDAELENFEDYFPGDLAVDWVGLSLFSQSTDLSPDLLERAMRFYHTFHQNKPIMLNFGISHFSTADHRYRISETAIALKQIYRAIKSDFPRIKMINYMDIVRLDLTGQDYRISIDPALRAAYQESVGDFITVAPRSFDNSAVSQAIRSSYFAHVEDGIVYLDTRILEEELSISVPGQTEWIDGTRKVNAALLDINVEIDQGHVWLRS
ncbi:MAG: hypothetical protein FWC91_01825 [Defluviitaleaceae bacterium]|nr:hypothetical protein [Defluviitaleaceae bacterium]